MINYDPKSWKGVLFRLAKADTISLLRKELVFIFCITLLLAFLELTLANVQIRASLEKLFSIYSLLGFVISLLLVFRTNTAYDRWWEGRRQWGALVNDSRNLAIKLASLDLSSEDLDFFARHIANFPLLTKEHLREGVKFEELDLKPDERAFLDKHAHAPSALVTLMWIRLQQLKKAGKLSEETLLLLDKNLNGFLDCAGACERIKNTPIPYSYSVFFKKFILIYVTTLPLALVPNFQYWSALIATFIFYVFVSLEVIAEEIEDPFGKDENDLPTDDMAMKIGTSAAGLLRQVGFTPGNLQ